MAANPRIHIHFTPTSASWPNLVEIWFGIIERQAFAPVRELMIKIRTFINGWNDRCHPFIWTKTADQIFKKANRQQLKLRSQVMQNTYSREAPALLRTASQHV
jgi:hypothetical protein